MKPQNLSSNVPKMSYILIPFIKYPAQGYDIEDLILIEFPDFRKIRKKKTGEILIKEANILRHKGERNLCWSDDRKRCFFFDPGGYYTYNLDCLSLSEGFYDKCVMDDKESALLKFELTEIGEYYG